MGPTDTHQWYRSATIRSTCPGVLRVDLRLNRRQHSPLSQGCVCWTLRADTIQRRASRCQDPATRTSFPTKARYTTSVNVTNFHLHSISRHKDLTATPQH